MVGYRDEQGTYFKARCMAEETGGKYFSVSTEDELVDALRKTLGCPFLTERSGEKAVKVPTRSGNIPDPALRNIEAANEAASAERHVAKLSASATEERP